MKETDPVRNWLEDGGLMRAVPFHVYKHFHEVYVHFSKDMEEVRIKHIPSLNRLMAKLERSLLMIQVGKR